MKGSVKRMRRQATDWEEYLQKTYLKKDCYPKYTKNLKLKKTKNLILKNDPGRSSVGLGRPRSSLGLWSPPPLASFPI